MALKVRHRDKHNGKQLSINYGQTKFVALTNWSSFLVVKFLVSNPTCQNLKMFEVIGIIFTKCSLNFKLERIH